MWHGKRSYNIDHFFEFLQKAKTDKFHYYIQKYGKEGEFLNGEHQALISKDEEWKFTFFDLSNMNNPLSIQELVLHGEQPIYIMNHYGEKVGDCPELKNIHILEMLKLSLMAMYVDWGINGFAMHTVEGLRIVIENMVEASMHNGKGKILKGDEIVYKYSYYGGLLYV